MSNNIIKYASRTYNTILSDINSVDELADKPDWFKKIIAGVGDVCSMINNGQANNSYLDTAFTRDAVKQLCRLIDYEMTEQTTSSGTMLFYFASDVTFPLTVTSDNLAATTKGSVSVSSKRFESRSDTTFSSTTEVVDLDTNPVSSNKIVVTRTFVTGEKVRLTTDDTLPTGLSTSTDYYVIYVDSTHIELATTAAKAYAGTVIDISDGSGNMTMTLYSGQVTCYQQQAYTDVNIGTSDGTTEWQEFDLPETGILDDTIVITINDVEWTQTDTLATATATDTYYQLVYNTDGSCFIRFGDGTYGAIPGNFDIISDYAVGGGSDSNISVLNSVSVYAGSDTNITGCSNATTMTGGADEQSITSAKNIAPGKLKSQGRFISISDGESLAVEYGGISISSVISNAYGLLSCKLVAIASGGGNPSDTLKTELQTYLKALTILENMDVRVKDATITSVDVTSAAYMLSGYTFSNVLPFFRLAWELLLSETGQEILDTYKSTGIEDAVTLINSIFSESFSTDDYNEITTMLDGFYNLGARYFGDTIRSDDIYSFIKSYVSGISYITVTSPSLPIELDDDEITTVGTLTLTEITD